MPLLPIQSRLNVPPNNSSRVDALAAEQQIPSDAIVVRGYLGRSDVMDAAIAFLQELVNRSLYGAAQFATMQAFLAGWNAQLPYRLYLSPRLDRYIEFDWDQHVVACSSRQSSNATMPTPSGSDVWKAQTIHGPDPDPVQNRADDVARARHGLPSGDMIEGYMDRAAGAASGTSGRRTLGAQPYEVPAIGHP